MADHTEPAPAPAPAGRVRTIAEAAAETAAGWPPPTPDQRELLALTFTAPAEESRTA